MNRLDAEDFERIVRGMWRGDGDPPPRLVAGQSQYDSLIEMGCPAHLLHLSMPIPLPPPKLQPRDWFRKFG